MKIYIQYCLGTAQTYQFDVDRCTTIKQLKEKLLQKLNTNNNADMDTLYFLQKDTEFFDETATLEDYEIEDETILQAVKPNSRSSFGGSGRRFADLSNDQGLKKIAWAKTAPEWRIAPHGLCLEGICNNETCKAFKQTVIIPIGYKRFDILVDSNSKTSYCPVCKKYVDPESCSFNNCWWKFEGKKQDKPGDEPKSCSSNWRMADDAYHCFDQEKSGLVSWRQLIIETVQNKPKS